MSWIKTSDRQPPIKCCSVFPFHSLIHRPCYDLGYTHFGSREDNDHWWCVSCQSWLEDSDVVAWFDLPPYEP